MVLEANILRMARFVVMQCAANGPRLLILPVMGDFFTLFISARSSCLHFIFYFGTCFLSFCFLTYFDARAGVTVERNLTLLPCSKTDKAQGTMCHSRYRKIKLLPWMYKTSIGMSIRHGAMGLDVRATATTERCDTPPYHSLAVYLSG